MSTFRTPNDECISQDIATKYRGNTECSQYGSIAGAGGYVSGMIHFVRPVTIYATIAGKGKFGKTIDEKNTPRCYLKENMIEGGYGGGGRAANWYNEGTGSGGGATSVKLSENDLWHRIIVAGGGGGADNYAQSLPAGGWDDGSGGSGGGLTAQGWWFNGTYIGDYLANSTFGFSFGQGEAAREFGSLNDFGVKDVKGESDRPGAGGGWFGGFASHNGDSGSGAGSSWALTKNAIFPSGKIDFYDEFYEWKDSKNYAFDKNYESLFKNVVHIPGIMKGNGRLIIKKLNLPSDYPQDDYINEYDIFMIFAIVTL